MNICTVCNKQFIGKDKYRKYTFCSDRCRGDSMKNKPGRIFKPRILRSGYYYCKVWGHPNGGKQKYIAEHRLVMEKKIGRFLKKEEVVHHINGNILDNSIENLELFSSHGHHTRVAHSDIYEKQKIIFKGKRFSPKSEFKKGQIPWNKGLKTKGNLKD